MPTNPVAYDEDAETLPTVEPTQLLIAFSPFERVFSALRRHRVTEDRSRAAEIHAAARDSVEPLDVDVRNPTVEPFPDTDPIQSYIPAFRTSKVYESFVAHRIQGPHELGMVPISQLIAVQSLVGRDAYTDMPTWEDDPISVLELTLPKKRSEEGYHATFSGEKSAGIELTSRTGNIEFDDVKLTRTADPLERQVVFSLRARPHIVRVMRWRDRLFLKNGYHRTAQLYQNGTGLVPAIIEDVDSYARISKGDQLIYQEMVLSERPPLVSDLHTDAAITIERRAKNKFFKFSCEISEVPR